MKLYSRNKPKWLQRVGVFSLALVLLALVGCDQTSDSVSESSNLTIVATNGILADWVGNVAGDRAEVLSLVPRSTDPHTFQPGAQDIRRVSDADIVFVVGLNLEAAWLNKLLENASTDTSKIVSLGEFVDPIEAGENDHDAHEGESHKDEVFDPHFWFDPLRVKIAVSEISNQLSAADPDGASVYQANALTYGAELDELHEWIVGRISEVSPERRLIVTSHDSFSYLGDRYDIEIVGSVIPGITTELDPAARSLTELVDEMQNLGVPAVFTEIGTNDRLAKRIAQEAGVKLVNGLYTGSLGDESGKANTYVNMVRNNVNEIVDALK